MGDEPRKNDEVIIEKLKNIGAKMDELKGEFKEFKADAYNKIQQNAIDIAKGKGIMAGIALLGGAFGGAIGAFVVKALGK